MAARDILNIKEQLICAICLEEFVDPRSLPCSHTFCHRCLADHISQSRSHGSTLTDRSFQCPSCRERVRLNPSRSVFAVSNDDLAASFPSNNLLGEIGDRVRLHESGSPSCEHHIAKPAEYFCYTGGVFLCPNCAISKHRTVNCHVIPMQDVHGKLKPGCEKLKQMYDDKTAELKSMLTKDYKSQLIGDIKTNTLIDILEFERQLSLFYANARRNIKGLSKRLDSQESVLLTNYDAEIRQMVVELERTKQRLDYIDKGSDWLLSLQNFPKDTNSILTNISKTINDFAATVFEKNVNITDLFQENISIGTFVKQGNNPNLHWMISRNVQGRRHNKPRVQLRPPHLKIKPSF